MQELFSWESHVDARTVRARTLLVTLGSFIDAGHVQRQVDAHLTNVCQNHVLGRFDVDALVDYRENRPMISFDRDHFEDYQPPEMALRELTDAHGEKFLLLSGVEPALRWEAVIVEIERIVDRLDVETTVMVQGIPMMVPHTRPTAVTRHASSPELIPGNRPMFGSVLMGASFPAVLELRLGEMGHDVVGLTAHVPHYLAQADFPDATIALLQGVRDVTGLHVPTSELAIAAGVIRAQLGAQLADNEEFQEVVSALEEQYDEVVSSRELTQREEELPTADEIGAEAERFLQAAQEPDVDGDGERPESTSNPDQHE